MKSIGVLAALATLTILTSCGNNSGSGPSSVPNPLLAPGSNVAEVQWSQVTASGMDQVRLQLDPRQDSDHQIWNGEEVVHLVRQLPDSMVVQLGAAILDGQPQQSGDPDHDHDHDPGHRGRARPFSREQIFQGAMFRIFPANAASGLENGGFGSSSIERPARLSFDSTGILQVQMDGLSSLIQYPSCGSSWILEIDLRHIRIRLPLEIDC